MQTPAFRNNSVDRRSAQLACRIGDSVILCDIAAYRVGKRLTFACLETHVGLVHDTELQVRSRDFENDVVIAFEADPSAPLLVRSIDSLELDVRLEKGTVSADERASRSC